MVFSPDLRLADRYQLVSRIGHGGMSEVWRATDELLGRPVAVKALASPLAVDPALRAGTRQEARAAARLTHPNVTQVYDYGEANLATSSVPVPYLVMELVDGQNLAERLSHGPLPWRDAVQVSAQVAAGLAAAHTLGVVHRDIKPGNVMLTPNGAKILDFGIATLTGAHPEDDAGWLIGTPAYAAPERLRAGVADPAGDVYALGVLLYEALTGRTPVTIRSWEEAAAVHQRGVQPDPPHAPGLPADVTALCLACLAPDPADRPRAEDVAARLAALVGLPYAAAAQAAHPPTLIDRSRSMPQAGGRPGVARIAASAAVVHHHAPGPDEIEQPAGRPAGPSRLLIVAIAGAVIAAGIALALIATALHADRSSNGAAAPSVSTGDPTPPVTSTGPPPRATPTTDEEILAEIDALITEAVESGTSDEVAQELRDKVEDVRTKLDDRKRKKLHDEAGKLLEKIQEFAADGQLPAEIADRMEATLQPLVEDNGHGRDDDG